MVGYIGQFSLDKVRLSVVRWSFVTLSEVGFALVVLG